MTLFLVFLGLGVAFSGGCYIGYGMGVEAAWRAFFRGMKRGFKE